MSSISVNTITDASGGSTTSINGFTPSVSNMAGRNRIINGCMRIAQRGTSVSGTVGFYALDRWRGYSASSFPITQEVFTLGQTDVPNEPKNYLRVGTGGAVKSLSQRIEDVRTGAGQTFTLSFYAKASTSFDLVLGYTQYFGSGGSSGVSGTFGTSSITTSWQKFEVTFTLPSIAGKTIGAGDFLQITFADGGTYIPATTTFDITLVQLEEGSVATPFEHRQYGQEEMLCKRYYQKYVGGSGAYGYIGITMGVGSGTAISSMFPFEQEMRAAPSTSYDLTGMGVWDGASLRAITATSSEYKNTKGMRIDMVVGGGGLTTGHSYSTYGSTSTVVQLNAEL